MSYKCAAQIKRVESTSFIFHRIFSENRIAKKATVIEVAPGYEPKIGNALALFGFCGTVYLIEPDQKAARFIKKIYENIMPEASVKLVIKKLQDTKVGFDVPRGIDALVASHPFDDMVIDSVVNQPSFFSQEEVEENKDHLPAAIKNIYDNIGDEDYVFGIQNTLSVWKNFIAKLNPSFFIASQYPSR